MSKQIEKTISIQAPKEKVWEVLIKDEYNRQWYAEFSEGSKAQTDWKEGSPVLFTDNSGNGLAGKIISNKPAEELIIEYTGFVAGGKEDQESEGAKAVQGGKESYKLVQNGNTTNLIAQCDMDEQMYEMMASAWDRAAAKIKELAEKA